MTHSIDTPSDFAAGGTRLTLERPHGEGRDLRAWDAADEQLVAEARQRLRPGQRVAVVDDSFGALALGLADFNPTVIADSAALAASLSRNAGLNQRLAPNLHGWQDELGETVEAGWPVVEGSHFDAVILKVPRQLDYLEFLLRWSNQVLQPAGWLLTGGMIKHLPEQAARLYQRLVTTEAVLPARKKARLVVCRAGTETLDGWNALWKGYSLPELRAPVQALPAVFARERLDIGTRELLPFVSRAVVRLPAGAPVLDLACGNGVLGLHALVEREDLALTFADISSQAILSVRANVTAAGLGQSQCQFRHADGVPGAAGPFRCVLLNPPFHEGGAVGDHIAVRLFAEAARVLTPDGEMVLVGNRHLGYHKTLKAAFADVRQLHATPKFVVFRARQPRQRGGRS